MKTVLFFGIFDPKYARNRVLTTGFERNGWKVAECRIDPRATRGMRKYLALARLGLAARKEPHDLVIVCFPGQSVVWLARLLFGKHIVFDAFLSLYDSNVFDRKVYGPKSLRAQKDRMLDTWSCRLAWKVLLDTNEHIGYFVKTFGIPRGKFFRVWISADDTVFMPRAAAGEEEFTVHFHGTFIPLQGISYIIDAANQLRHEGLRFRIIGSGQETPLIEEQVKKLGLESIIERTGKLPIAEVARHMESAQIVLGIFGDTEKTKRVIPNKVYEAMAMGKAIITADTQAIRELPSAPSALVLVPVADARALADAIRGLKADDARREALGRSAYELYDRECRPEKIVSALISELRL